MFFSSIKGINILISKGMSNMSWAKTVWIFFYFNFERNYDIFKSKSPCILLNKNINFDKSVMESKTENPTHSFRETNLVLQLI